jgi:hypothetical protein
MQCPRCGSTTRIGDNNGESCMNCGQQNTCIHQWYAEPHMKWKTCTFCEQSSVNENYDWKADTIRHCPGCKDDTRHKIVLYNPDHPEDGYAYQCQDCEEITELISQV